MPWTVETLNATVDKELDSLSLNMRARFVHICELIERFGYEHVGMPHVKHLTGRIWEMRMKEARALYVRVQGERIVVVRVFVKKTQKIPLREIVLAQKRANELLL